jgi:hypothetical protein
MFDFYDFTTAQFLDALADTYETRGYRVQYLPFVYSVDYFPLNANDQQSRQVEINADADFICTALTYVANVVGGAGLVLPLVTASVVIDNNQRSLTNVPTVLGNLYGTGPRPGNLFKPLVLPANSTLTITLQNQASGVNYEIRLSHVGVKAFLFPAS